MKRPTAAQLPPRPPPVWDHGSYDALRNPADCLHCGGSELAPSGGDSITACGFCDPSVAPL